MGCSNTNQNSVTITGSSTTILGLEEGNKYSITVKATNNAGSSEKSDPVTAMTTETSEIVSNVV